ncbi:MFS transporter [Termitidicoccus mucosus]|uniref:MFS transporter n=1 Tax=Termitidicoccus mucosus TaxID=1184151 RepID=A0A178IIT1_9BACT|nr:MFS transporter [Opitutaceae bacterium TSB47]
MSSATDRKFRYWQNRTLVGAMIGYIAFYFVRNSLSFAIPAMQADGYTKTNLGIFITLNGLLYGVSKFANGILGDRANARVFMVTGLVLSAAANIIFGFGTSLIMLGAVWMANGWIQGMGFPPCARLMTHWFPPEQLATKMSIWNTSHSIGMGLASIGCGYIVTHFGWHWGFFGPALLVLLLAATLWLVLRDTPGSVGLPEIATTGSTGAISKQSFGEFMRFAGEHVFRNPYIWIIAVANFFVYTMRYSVLNWGPTMLTETRHVPLVGAGWMIAAFEISGVAGMLVAGRMTDKLFGGRGARVCLICMVLATLSMLLFWKLWATAPVWLAMLPLFLAGFFIYGPQALVGIAVANLATKRAAATAVGLTGLFGYGSALLTGWGLGKLAQTHGWGVALGAIAATGLAGSLLFAFAWRAKAHGYGDASRPV